MVADPCGGDCIRLGQLERTLRRHAANAKQGIADVNRADVADKGVQIGQV